MQMFEHNTTGDTYLVEDCTALHAIEGPLKDAGAVAYLAGDGTLLDVDEVTPVTVYRIGNKTFSEDDSKLAARHLAELFQATLDECAPETRAKLRGDTAALREMFGAWSDSLCKGGDICDDSYSDLDIDETALRL